MNEPKMNHVEFTGQLLEDPLADRTGTGKPCAYAKALVPTHSAESAPIRLDVLAYGAAIPPLLTARRGDTLSFDGKLQEPHVLANSDVALRMIAFAIEPQIAATTTPSQSHLPCDTPDTPQTDDDLQYLLRLFGQQ